MWPVWVLTSQDFTVYRRLCYKTPSRDTCKDKQKYPTGKPSTPFRYVDYETANLSEFCLDFKISEIIPLSAIRISCFPKQFQLILQFYNADSEKFWVFR